MTVLSAEKDRLVVCCKKNPSALAQVFCFPFSGAGPAYFRRWCQQWPQSLEFWAVQLPGREGRHADKMDISLAQTVRDLATLIAAKSEKPFVFFGHSLGAYLAWCTALQMRQMCTSKGQNVTSGAVDKLPKALFLSARQPPDIEHAEPLASLSDSALLAKLIDMGGIPAAVQNEPELLGYVLPKIRYDLSLNETSMTTLFEGREALDIPLYVYEGTRDRHTKDCDLSHWKDFTTGAFNHHRVEGDHFYIERKETGFARYFENDLRAVLFNEELVAR
jgi:medium-chain acyl-[acyl-carrier-protein] hydrolase